MISSHKFTGSALASGYRSVHSLMSCLRELTDTNEGNTMKVTTFGEWDKKMVLFKVLNNDSCRKIILQFLQKKKSEKNRLKLQAVACRKYAKKLFL